MAYDDFLKRLYSLESIKADDKGLDSAIEILDSLQNDTDVLQDIESKRHLEQAYLRAYIIHGAPELAVACTKDLIQRNLLEPWAAVAIAETAFGIGENLPLAKSLALHASLGMDESAAMDLWATKKAQYLLLHIATLENDPLEAQMNLVTEILAFHPMDGPMHHLRSAMRSIAAANELPWYFEPVLHELWAETAFEVKFRGADSQLLEEVEGWIARVEPVPSMTNSKS